MASSSAITTRIGTGCLQGQGAESEAFSAQLVEQLVLTSFELLDSCPYFGSVPIHCGRVLLCLAVLAVGDGRLRDECAEPGVVRGVGQVRELLVGDGELGPELLQPLGHLNQLALDQRPGHRGDSTGRPARLPPARRP